MAYISEVGGQYGGVRWSGCAPDSRGVVGADESIGEAALAKFLLH